MPGVTGGTTVNRMRIRCRGIDSSVAQVRARRWLDDDALQPEWLPPAAILCIRRLLDPQPGLVTLDATRPVPARWTHAVAATIGDRARVAAYPVRGDVPANAEAVVFADRAEMLACLASDWCTGALAVRWWWRALVGQPAGAGEIARAWLATPRHVAAALEQAGRLGVAERFVGRLDTGVVLALLRSVIVEHGLRRLGTAVDQLAAPGATTGVRRRADHPRAAGAVAPWSACVPECTTGRLRPDQQCLLGVALTLRRQPWRVRTAAFVAALEDWTDDLVRSGEASEQVSRGPVAGAAHPGAVDGGAVAESETEPTPMARPVGSRRSNSTSGSPCAAIVDSQVGGVFYLLNAAIALDLYGDFTRPGQRGIDLPIWDFVWLIGRRLAPRCCRRDPIWTLLAQLAGRAARTPFRAPRWLFQSLMPDLRVRIARALGVGRPRDAGPLLCVHRARVVTSPTHLDVFFSLDAHPMAIRLGGLDRDPGWIPAADRIVTFHYNSARPR